jgi:hypothetical protein
MSWDIENHLNITAERDEALCCFEAQSEAQIIPQNNLKLFDLILK